MNGFGCTRLFFMYEQFYTEKNLLVNFDFLKENLLFLQYNSKYSSCGIFTFLNSNFYDFCSKLADPVIFRFNSKNYYFKK